MTDADEKKTVQFSDGDGGGGGGGGSVAVVAAFVLELASAATRAVVVVTAEAVAVYPLRYFTQVQAILQLPLSAVITVAVVAGVEISAACSY